MKRKGIWIGCLAAWQLERIADVRGGWRKGWLRRLVDFVGGWSIPSIAIAIHVNTRGRVTLSYTYILKFLKFTGGSRSYGMSHLSFRAASETNAKLIAVAALGIW